MSEYYVEWDIVRKDPKAEQALADSDCQMATWNLPLPPARLVALDFGLGHFRQVRIIQYSIQDCQ